MIGRYAGGLAGSAFTLAGTALGALFNVFAIGLFAQMGLVTHLVSLLVPALGYERPALHPHPSFDPRSVVGFAQRYLGGPLARCGQPRAAGRASRRSSVRVSAPPTAACCCVA